MPSLSRNKTDYRTAFFSTFAQPKLREYDREIIDRQS